MQTADILPTKFHTLFEPSLFTAGHGTGGPCLSPGLLQGQDLWMTK